MTEIALFAGMPRVSLNEVAKLRLEVISFFILFFVIATLIFLLLWNGLARDFPKLPRLTFLRAFAFVAVWGGFFILVLTMISGARELMTPGAWKPDGITYKLDEPSKVEASAPPETTSWDTRRQKLQSIRAELWKFADEKGHFPDHDEAAAINADLLLVPHPAGLRYIYYPQNKLSAQPPLPLVVEPAIFDDGRLTLHTDGSIALVPYSAAPNTASSAVVP